MRQVFFQVPRGQGPRVLDAAKRRGSVNLSLVEARGADDQQHDLVMAHVPNGEVGPLLDELEPLEDLRVSFSPSGVLALKPPKEEAPDQVTNLDERSALEVYLAGLQSVGSWRGFLGYAAAAGVVVWIGLFTNTIYLLVAAMLIAPFAGPAMNAAIATARGDATLIGRSLARYFAALLTTAAVAGILSLLLGQRIATTLMADITSVSAAALLLPLSAGAAGALNLVQSEHKSLVSGAAVGILVAASLAPPAGILGMATAIQRWDMVGAAAFLIVLQLAGINLSGAAVFRAFGVRPSGNRYPEGKKKVVVAAFALTLLLVSSLLAWQLWDEPHLQRSTLSQRAAADVRDVVASSGIAQLVEANARFTRAEIPGQDTLLVVAYVQAASDTTLSPDDIEDELTRRIQQRLETADYGATPLVDVTVLQPPEAA